jgi:hypothetical protein
VRYLAIHTNGYGGSGIARPVFEIEADDPTSPALEVFMVPGGEGIRAAQHEMDDDPGITAGVLAWITGGQHIGYLAQKEDDEVVYSVRGPIAEEDQFPWQTLNPPSYWTGDPTDDLPSANEPIPAGTMTASEVMENHVVED